jgi:hypothetical protein
MEAVLRSIGRELTVELQRDSEILQAGFGHSCGLGGELSLGNRTILIGFKSR